jgi:membrane protease YdiL (CAAX protease family)
MHHPQFPKIGLVPLLGLAISYLLLAATPFLLGSVLGQSLGAGSSALGILAWVGLVFLLFGLAGRRLSVGLDHLLGADPWRRPAWADLASLAAGLLGIRLALYLPLSNYTILVPDHGIDQQINAMLDGFSDGLAILWIAILAPVFEECLCRGFLQPALERRFGRRPGLVLASLAFTALHGNLVQAPGAFCLGLLCGLARQRSGSVLPGIALHIGNNLVACSAAILPLLTIGDPAPTPASLAGLAAGLAGLGVYGRWLARHPGPGVPRLAVPGLAMNPVGS